MRYLLREFGSEATGLAVGLGGGSGSEGGFGGTFSPSPRTWNVLVLAAGDELGAQVRHHFVWIYNGILVASEKLDNEGPAKRV